MVVLTDVLNLRNDHDLVPKCSGVYKWWCKRDLLMRVLDSLDLSFNEVNSDLEKKSIDGVDYYCIYVGDSSNLYKRYFSNAGHISGQHNRRNIEKGFLSTYRVSISSILLGDQSKELETNEILDQMKVELFYGEDIEGNYHDFQNQQINSYFRPVNNDDICKENPLYSEFRHYENPKTKNAHFKYSWKITQLRNEAKKEGLKHV